MECNLLNLFFYNHFSSHRNLNEYSVGSDERLELSMEVVNDGEDAYEANFFLDLPESINYIKTELLEVSSQGGTSPPVLCSPPSQRNEHVLKCDLGNPMARNSKVKGKYFALNITQ